MSIFICSMAVMALRFCGIGIIEQFSRMLGIFARKRRVSILEPTALLRGFIHRQSFSHSHPPLLESGK